MTSRPVILASVLAVLAVGVGLGLQTEESGLAREPNDVVRRPTGDVAASTDGTARQVSDGPTVASGAARRARPMKISSELASPGATLLAEQATVQLLAKDADLALTPEQWAAFAAVTSHYQVVRHEFEATIATVVASAPRQLQIPAYPAAGDALREKFYGELRERLGDTTATAIGERAGGALEGYFGGFGVGVQTLDFGAEADGRVTRTTQYWNSARSGDALTLRRETNFPASEDPTGERWGPFLALLASGGGDKAGS